MRPKVNNWISWTIEELEELIKQKNSCVFKENIRKHIPMYSIHLTDVKKSFQDILNSSINTFDPSFNGLLISYKNPTILDSLTPMFYDVQFVHVDLQADFYIFRPTVGSILTGIINKKEDNYIGVLMHKTFNVSITKHQKIESWPGHFLNVGDNATFRITQVDLKAKVPFIRGELMSEKTSENKRTDYGEEGGTELDSGYQESENEAKPSKSKSVPAFLTGAGSDSEEEERVRKVKKKKTKEPKLQNQDVPESPAQLPAKISKKRKRDNEENPKKESKKTKRLKADELSKKEDSSLQSGVFTANQPRIIQDEVLLSTNVNIKSENIVKKKKKKKTEMPVAHDISCSDGEISPLPWRFYSQEPQEEEKSDFKILREHNQKLAAAKSEDSSSEKKSESSSTIISGKKSPKKKIDEKKSPKIETQDLAKTREDKSQPSGISSQENKEYKDDEIRDHSQKFAAANSQDSSSDIESEIPKMIIYAKKSPKKKLKAQNTEGQLEFGRIDSQEDEETPRGRSQFSQGSEAKIPEHVGIKVEKEPEINKQTENLSENSPKKKAEKKPSRNESFTPEEIAERVERFRKRYEDVINEVAANPESYQIPESEEFTDSELLALKKHDPEHQSLVQANRANKLKAAASKTAKPLWNSTVIEPQLDSATPNWIQEPSVSPVLPEEKLKKSKTAKVVQPQEFQALERTEKPLEEVGSVGSVVKTYKNPKKKSLAVNSAVESSEIEPAVAFSAVKVKEEPKAKKLKTVQSIEPKSIETTVESGSLALLMENSEAQEPEVGEKKKKSKKSKKIPKEEMNAEEVQQNPVMNAVDKVLSSSRSPMILGGFSDSDDDPPDHPIVLSSVKIENNSEELANGAAKKKKSKKSKEREFEIRNCEASNFPDETVVVDITRVKEEKKKKKKKSMENSELSLANSSGIEVDTSIIKEESKKKKKKKKSAEGNKIIF